VRNILPMFLAAAAATLMITATADAAPRVAISVSIPQTAGTLSAKLASHSHVASVKGGHAKVAHGLVRITPSKRTVKITVRGGAPKAWSFTGSVCAGEHRVVCAKSDPAAGTPTSTGGTMPAGGSAPGAGGDDHGSNGGDSGTGGNGGDQGGNGGDADSHDGDVIPSFGGAAGSELATVVDCQKDVGDLVSAYQSVIDAYGTTHVDFDIVGAAVTDTTANGLRDQALVKLEQANPGLVVSFTLQADAAGLSPAGSKLVGDAVAGGVKVALVNGMAMDYYTPGAVGHMAEYAEFAGSSIKTQLAAIYPGLSSAQLAAKVGLTPMIGINDASDEIFALADAATLADWTTSSHIGMLGMWARLPVLVADRLRIDHLLRRAAGAVRLRHGARRLHRLSEPGPRGVIAPRAQRSTAPSSRA
jgi:hypothetical protein